MPDKIYDAVVIGGGAAGLFCAAKAGMLGLKVALLEHNAEVGRKILISGGGRCNFTNTGTAAENFISLNPHFARSALAGYTPADFVELVKSYRIPFYEKKLGQLFCRESARAMVDMLLAECRKGRVDVYTSCRVRSVSKEHGFTLDTSEGPFVSRGLVIACGGLSFPKIGATGFGYEVAKQFDIALTDTRPSLVALVLEGKPFTDLAGVSIDAEVATRHRSFRENILFTHRGMSGPAILQISNYWDPGEPVEIDLLPGHDLEDISETSKNVLNAFAEVLPGRAAEKLVPAALHKQKIRSLKKGDLDELVRALKARDFRFKATEGYDRAEVTLGGVSTDELSSKTMEARKVPGLYFIGEVVDVTGWLGGYNFQWAWSSAYAAAKAMARK